MRLRDGAAYVAESPLSAESQATEITFRDSLNESTFRDNSLPSTLPRLRILIPLAIGKLSASDRSRNISRALRAQPFRHYNYGSRSKEIIWIYCEVFLRASKFYLSR